MGFNNITFQECTWVEILWKENCIALFKPSLFKTESVTDDMLNDVSIPFET